jgi:hypothetical protein
LKKYQGQIDFSILPEMNRFIDVMKRNPSQDSLRLDYQDITVLNILNAKNIVYIESATPLINPNAWGNEWFVKVVKKANNADE